MSLTKMLLLLNFIHVVAAFSAIASLLGFAGALWWRFELLDHPRPQYCLALIAALLVGLLLQQKWSIVWFIPLMLNLALLAPLFFAPFKVDQNSQAPTIRLLHANLDRHNSQPEQAIRYLKQQSVDLMLLQEITPAWLARLQAELPEYQILKAEALDNTLGSAILVPQQNQQIKVEQVQVIHLPKDSDRPLLETTVTYAGRPLVILSYHVIRPRSPKTSAYQEIEFDSVSTWSQAQLHQQKRVVVIGDFNSTAWSVRLRRLEKDSQLLNSQRGFGFQPTWSAEFPPLMKIAIDHCFHDRSLVTVQRSIGSAIGSDHLPFLVELRNQ